MRDKIALTVRLLALIVASCFMGHASAESWTDPNTGIQWHYIISGNKAVIDNSGLSAIPNTTLGAITVPSVLGGCQVTSIGYCAFRNCSGLTRVNIPDSVESIGDYAFYKCSGLTSVHMSSRITSIGYCAFQGCSGLKSVAIPERVASIGDYAFFNCTGLTSIIIHSNVVSLNSSIFYGCIGVLDVTIPESVCSSPLWSVFPSAANSITNVVVCEGTTSIGDYAFSNAISLQEVSIPNSVTNIGNGVFQFCSSLKSIVVDKSNDYYSSVNGLLLSKDGSELIQGVNGDVFIPDSVSKIVDSAFQYCSNVFSLTIPQCICSSRLSSVFPAAYHSITNVVVGDSVTTIGRYAFYDCDGLLYVTISRNVTSIGDYAFSGCCSLLSFFVDEDNNDYSSVNGVLLSKDKNTLIKGVNRNVMIPESVTNIGDYAFHNCKALTIMDIPNHVMRIGYQAFCGCSGLESIMIPDSVIEIDHHAFEGCSSLSEITIPDSVTSIGEGAFSDCSNLAYFEVGHDNQFYTSSSGLLLSKDGKDLIRGINGDVEVPNGVETIKIFAFRGCRELTSVTIPDSVTNVEYEAFADCGDAPFDNMTVPGVTLVDGWAIGYTDSISSDLDLTGIRGVGAAAFIGCGDLTSVVIPNGVMSIGDGAFGYCRKLTSVTMPNSVTSIGADVFYDCSGLMSVTIPNGVTSIGEGAFYGCSGLTSLSLPVGLSSIERSTFAGCSSLTNIVVPNGVTRIMGNAFEGCRKLNSITIPSGVTYLGSYLFSNCIALESIILPDSVAHIDDGAFRGCSGLTSIVIPNSVTNVGYEAFVGCGDSLFDNMTVPGVTLVDGWAIGYTDSINSDLTLVGVRGIANEAFYGCDALTRVIIPDGVHSIGMFSFNGCCNLTAFDVALGNPNYMSVGGLLLSRDGKTLVCGVNGDVIIPDGITSIGDNAFSDFQGLKKVIIPDGVISIGSFAFDSCNGLSAITIPRSVTKIDSNAFSWCTGLREITFVGDSPTIGTRTFARISQDSVVYLPLDNETYDVVDGRWQGIVVEYWEDGFPEIKTDTEVACAMIGTVDARLSAIITDIDEYNVYREWALQVKNKNGESIGDVAVKASQHAAVSYMLGANVLLDSEPTIELSAVEVDDGSGNGSDKGAITLCVTVTDGGNPVTVASEKVAAMFEATSSLDDWNGEARLIPKVEVLEGDGNIMRFKVKPGDGSAKSAFLRIRR